MQFEMDELEGGLTLVRLIGRLDTSGVDRVETRFAAVATRRGSSVVLDMSGVEFVGSMGIRMLISTGRALTAQSQRIALFGVQPQVRDVLDRVGLPALMPVTADRAGAIEAIRA